MSRRRPLPLLGEGLFLFAREVWESHQMRTATNCRSSIARAIFVWLCLGWTTMAAAQSPAPANRTLTRIAIGSCAYQEIEQPIWSAVHAYRPELFLFAGDNVYGDVQDGKVVTDPTQLPSSIAAAYARAAAIPGMKTLRETVPHLAVWDDHDYGKNDGGADFPLKGEAKRQFIEFWALPPNDPRRTRDGLYDAYTFGPPGQRVQVILLDTRWFRSPLKPTDQRAKGKEVWVPDDEPSKTMLGAAQWTWLEEQLKVPADLRLIVSSIQVLADGHGWEKWANLPRERQKLFDLIGAAKANRVVFLSGDRHIGGLYRETKGAPYPLYEMTSSGLTQFFSGSNEDGQNRVGAVFGAVNFGTIDIDWWTGTVALSLRSMNGEVVRRQTIELAEMAGQ
jgi:alkaline phosphatase D